MYFYVSKTNLLAKCPKATKEELAILCELKGIDIDWYRDKWATHDIYDGVLLSEYIEEEL